MYKISNVAMDPKFANLRRRASNLEMEPTVCGNRLPLRGSVTVSVERFTKDKARIEFFKNQGVLEYVRLPQGSLDYITPPGEEAASAPVVVEEAPVEETVADAAPVEVAAPPAPPAPPAPEEPSTPFSLKTKKKGR